MYTGKEEGPGESCYLAVELYAQTDSNVYDECNGNLVSVSSIRFGIQGSKQTRHLKFWLMMN